jgi:predicted DNA-binding transcriptional regulator AlpA
MQLLTKREVAAKCGVHPESIARLVRVGRFPKPIRLGGDAKSNRVRFVESEVNDWLAARMTART